MGAIVKCECCRKEYELKGYRINNYCPDCIYKRDVVATTFFCKICGASFVLDGMQIEKLKARFAEDYKEPCKCKKCKQSY